MASEILTLPMAPWALSGSVCVDWPYVKPDSSAPATKRQKVLLTTEFGILPSVSRSLVYTIAYPLIKMFGLSPDKWGTRKSCFQWTISKHPRADLKIDQELL